MGYKIEYKDTNKKAVARWRLLTQGFLNRYILTDYLNRCTTRPISRAPLV